MIGLTEAQQLFIESQPKAQQKALIKALGGTVEVELFERFDFQPPDKPNGQKQAEVPMLMVNSKDGKKHKAIPVWVATMIKDNAEEFILAIETLLEELKSN